jgi:hypothetical protein
MKKDIYFYWGNETMSYMRYMTLYSFRLFNPTWNMYLIKNNKPSKRSIRWTTPERQDKTEYRGKDYSSLLSDLRICMIEFSNSMVDLDEKIVDDMSDVHIKDVLNWKLLSEQGGVVADMDILFIKPITDEINDDSEVGLVCFDGHPKKDYIPVTFMYSSGHNEFFENTYLNALRRYNPNVYESCGTLCIKEKNLNEIRESYSNLIIQRLDDGIIFPFIRYEWGLGVQMLYNGDHTSEMLKESIGVHWYAGTQLSQIYNNKINKQTVGLINNTITLLMRKILCHNLDNPPPVLEY